MSLVIYTGDLEHDLEVEIGPARAGDPAVDLTAATAIRVIGTHNGTLLFDRAPTSTVVDGDSTVVTMAFQAGDTDLIGRIRIEIEATWPVGRPQTFVPDGGVDVRRDYDYVETP